MVISNEIFETYRIQERAREQLKAIRLLAKQGYTIIDLESRIINKTNIDSLDDRDSIKSIKYNRVPKKSIFKQIKMNKMSVIGKIKRITEVEERGTFRFRKLIVETQEREEKYNQTICVDFVPEQLWTT